MADEDPIAAPDAATIAGLQKRLDDAHATIEALKAVIDNVPVLTERRDLLAEIELLKSQRADALQQSARLRAQVAAATHEQNSLLDSTSWRLTAPLRKTARVYQALRRDPRGILSLARLKFRKVGRGGSTTAPDPALYDSLSLRDQLVVWIRCELARRSR